LNAKTGVCDSKCLQSLRTLFVDHCISDLVQLILRKSQTLGTCYNCKHAAVVN
jgi:hypothetical protein